MQMIVRNNIAITYMLSRESTLAQLVTYLGASSVICYQLHLYVLISCSVNCTRSGQSAHVRIQCAAKDHNYCYSLTLANHLVSFSKWSICSFCDNGTSWFLTVSYYLVHGDYI